jgi:hypothetical protein
VLLHRGVNLGCAHGTNPVNLNLKKIEKSKLMLEVPFKDNCAVHLSPLMMRQRERFDKIAMLSNLPLKVAH